MIGLFFYIGTLLIELLFFFFFSIIAVFLIYSSIKGSPYVPTKSADIDLILKNAQIKKDQVFLDLGCGDGRVVRQAAKKYGAYGIGIDINLLMIYWAQFLAKLTHTISVEFKVMDIVSQKLPKADVVYIFLMPKLIEKIKPKLKNYLDNKCLIISHGFYIKGFNQYCIKKIDGNPFGTFFYRISEDI